MATTPDDVVEASERVEMKRMSGNGIDSDRGLGHEAPASGLQGPRQGDGRCAARDSRRARSRSDARENKTGGLAANVRERESEEVWLTPTHPNPSDRRSRTWRFRRC